MIRDQELLDELVAAVSRFTRQRLIPLESEVASEDRIPDDVVAEMRSLGLFGLTIPEEYGGLGLTSEEELCVIREMCHASPVFRSLIGTNNGIGSQGIILAGTEDQKQRYLPALASGEMIASFCLTEPDAGSDAASIRTIATRTASGYSLRGLKRYITNAPSAGLFTVFARTNPAEPGARGISAFLVPRSTPGVCLGKPERKMGQHGGQVCDVVFDDCEVPADALLGSEGEGFRTAMRVLDRGRLHISAVCVGAAERLIAESVEYAKNRRQFGTPIGDFQLVQAMLADSRTEAYAAWCMAIETARQRDAGADVSAEASCCKYFASEMVGRVADRAVQIHGGAGYIADYAVERFYRDVRLFRLYEGTSQVQQLIIARRLLRGAA